MKGKLFIILLNCVLLLNVYGTNSDDKNESGHLDSIFLKMCTHLKDSALPNLDLDLKSYNDSFYFYHVDDLTITTNQTKTLFQKYYKYVKVYFKGTNSIECNKFETICLLFKFNRILGFKEECYEMEKTSALYTNLVDFKNSFKTNFLEEYFEKVEIDECDAVFKDTHDCEKPSVQEYEENLNQNIIDNYELWNYFAFNTFFAIIALISNLFAMIFLIRAFLLSKFASVPSYFIIILSNILYLITYWLLYISPTSQSLINLFFNKKDGFGILFCNIIPIFNSFAFYLSELMIVKLSLVKTFSTCFPNCSSSFKLKLAPISFMSDALVILIAAGFPFITEFSNRVRDSDEYNYLNENDFIPEFCYSDVLSDSLKSWINISVVMFLTLLVLISLVILLMKLLIQANNNVNVKNTELEFKEKLLNKANDSENEASKADNSSVIAISLIMITFNIFYALLIIYKLNLDFFLNNNDFKSKIILRETIINILLWKISAVGILIFVLSRIFHK